MVFPFLRWWKWASDKVTCLLLCSWVTMDFRCGWLWVHALILNHSLNKLLEGSYASLPGGLTLPAQILFCGLHCTSCLSGEHWYLRSSTHPCKLNYLKWSPEPFISHHTQGTPLKTSWVPSPSSSSRPTCSLSLSVPGISSSKPDLTNSTEYGEELAGLHLYVTEKLPKSTCIGE